MTQDINKQIELAESYLVKAAEILNALHCWDKPGAQFPTATPEKTTIIWSKKTGPNGDYEKAEDQDGTEFAELQKRIDSKQGKLNENGYFYWVFQNGAIGRKPAKTNGGH